MYALNIPGGSAGQDSACNVGDLGSIFELGRYPGEGNGYPLQYSGLENAMDCTVQGVAKSRTEQLSHSLLNILHFIYQLDLHKAREKEDKKKTD